jgi:hypothetical protein
MVSGGLSTGSIETQNLVLRPEHFVEDVDKDLDKSSRMGSSGRCAGRA